MVEPEQAFPYPEVLTPDQFETMQMMVDPAEKFFQEVNDPLKNDADEVVPEEVTQVIYIGMMGFIGF